MDQSRRNATFDSVRRGGRPMSRRRVACLSALLMATAMLGGIEQRAQAEESSRVGRTIEDFSLRDFRGKTHSLAEFADQKLVVVAFLGTECPLVKVYAPRLVELAEQYRSQGVAFVGINSNHQDTVTEVGAFAERAHIGFPMLKDPDNSVADRFAAVRTPEVFVLDNQRVVRYWGRIDDQYGVGYQKKEAERHDLAVALDELLAGQAVSAPVHEAPGCLIGRTQKATPHGDVTYAKQISRVMQNRCIECHREGQLAPFPLTSFDEVVGWADMICEVIDQGRMPPWFANPEHGKFKNDCRMTDEEKQLVHTWVTNGCPEGNDADLPAPREFATGWRIPEPDAVFYMSDEPYEVQAEGTVQYQFFEVDPGFTEDKWIQAAEARPGNPEVVHHIIVFIRSPGGGSEFSQGAQLGYAPGMPPRIFEPGTAVKVPAGSKLYFQMHYTPIGTVQQDRSYIGFKFADPATVQKTVRPAVAGNFSFRIAPGDGNFEVTARKRFRRDTLLTSILPHMHVRGKDMRLELEYPDGHREVVLDVPHYDFNWQLWYNLTEPKLIPKGSKLHVVAHFDNSEENPFNPDPTKEVTWGEQTWEEMMFAFMSTIDPNEDRSKSTADEVDEEEEEANRKAAF